MKVIVHVDNILVQIIDNGVGIESEYLPKIFRNFFQVEDYPDENTGYGIGLALSQSIVNLHHGNISVQSRKETVEQPGQTVFTIELLSGKEHFGNSIIFFDTATEAFPSVERQLNPISSPEIVMAKNNVSKEATILIVEDNAEIRKLLKNDLQSEYNIEVATDGQDGWERATEFIPDVIISDVMMPRMDGFELCHRLKAERCTSHIPIILLTAKDQLSDQMEGLETGADIYITKPFHMRSLELHVRNLLHRREAIRQQLFHTLSSGSLFSAHAEEQPFVPSESNSSATPQFVNSVDQEFYEYLVKMIQENLEQPEFNITLLCRKIAMSESVLYKKVKALTGMTVVALIKNIRMQKAASMLSDKRYTIFEISIAVGYSDRKYFSKEFKKHFGVAPTQYGIDTGK